MTRVMVYVLCSVLWSLPFSSSSRAADPTEPGVLIVAREKVLRLGGIGWDVILNGNSVGSVGNGENRVFKAAFLPKAKNTVYIQEIQPAWAKAIDDHIRTAKNDPLRNLSLALCAWFGGVERADAESAFDEFVPASNEFQFEAGAGSIVTLSGGYRVQSIKDELTNPQGRFDLRLSVEGGGTVLGENLANVQIDLGEKLFEREISREIVRMPGGTTMRETRRRSLIRSIELDTTATAELGVECGLGTRLLAMLHLEIAGEFERKWGKRISDIETIEKTIEIDGSVAPVVEIIWVAKYCRGAAELKLTDVQRTIPFEVPVSLELRCNVPSKSKARRASENDQ